MSQEYLPSARLIMLQGGPRAKLSRDLVALWADDHPPALDLLRRIFPPGLMRFLNQPTSQSIADPSRPALPHVATSAQVPARLP